MRALLISLLIVVLLAATVLGLQQRVLPVADRWNPFAAYVLDEVPNVLTAFKLRRAMRDAQRCQAVLETAGFTYSRLPDRVTGEGCGFQNAVLLTRSGVAIGPATSLSCPAAVALAAWERYGLQPVAKAAFGQRVVRLEHFGSYACRDVSGRAGRRSGHATADALDVAGFILEDGRRIRVVQLPAEGAQTPEARFLDAARDAACESFGTVLGPAYNAAHHDHFHLEAGGWGACR
jgi:hypothetical protein